MIEAGKVIRLYQVLRPEDDKALIVKLDYGLVNIPPPNDDVLGYANRLVEAGVDGIVVSMGMLKRVYKCFRGRRAPAPVIRLDWTNVLRLRGHPLPPRGGTHIVYGGVEEALAMGATAVYHSFIVGVEEEREAYELDSVSSLARVADEYGLPLFIEVIPYGERVIEENYMDVIGLGARMAVEAGADCIAIPWPGSLEGVKDLLKVLNVPVLLTEQLAKTSKWQPTPSMNELVEAGRMANGLILSYRRAVEWRVEELSSIVQKLHKGDSR